MNKTDKVIRDAIRGFETIETFDKEMDDMLNHDLCADTIVVMNAMLNAIRAVTNCQIQSLKTTLGPTKES